VKSYLTVREIEFDSVNIAEDPAGYDRLVALGAMTTPVVAIGDRWVAGAAFDRLDEFFRTRGASAVATPDAALAGDAVGNVMSPGDAPLILDPPTLIARLDTLLSKAVRYTLEIPDGLLGQGLPVRADEGRTVRGLAFHIRQVAYDPLRAVDGMRIVKAMHEYDPPGWLHTADDLATETELVRARLLAWWQRAPQPLTYGIVDYYQGPYTFHGLLERCTWHVATHVRQLAWVLAEEGVDPSARLSDDDVRGLPIPVSVWK